MGFLGGTIYRQDCFQPPHPLETALYSSEFNVTLHTNKASDFDVHCNLVLVSFFSMFTYHCYM